MTAPTKPAEAVQLDYLHRLQQYLDVVDQSIPHSIGFPASVDFDYSALYPFFGYMLNNVGDPYDEDPLYLAHTKPFEQEVITFFADLFRLPQDDRWGYVTNGGSEGNLYALYLARELHSKARLYYSDAAHYSVDKAASMLRLPVSKVCATSTGEMDYDDLQRQLAKHSTKPAIVVATIGTTMTEARDNVATIKTQLEASKVPAYYIHSDAALAGIPSAFLEPHLPFDIADGADSISISGHKFIGSPIPSGLVLTRKSLHGRVSRDGMYTGAADTTISGSRNGHAPLFMWYAIKRWGLEGFRRRALDSMQLATYACERIQNAGHDAWRNPHAMSVIFKTPHDSIVRTWQLATHDGWSHIICMPGITRAQIDAFVADLTAKS